MNKIINSFNKKPDSYKKTKPNPLHKDKFRRQNLGVIIDTSTLMISIKYTLHLCSPQSGKSKVQLHKL